MYTTLCGFEIAYEEAGQGTPLLMMHAFPLDRRIFRPLPAARLITFDAPGAGESPVPAGIVSIDALADAAAALLDHLGLARAVVGGVSMGGYAALRFVARRPERLLGLVLANTRAAADTEQAKQARYEMVDAVRREGSAEIARRMVPRLLGESTRRENPALVEKVTRWIEAQPADGIARLLEALATRADSTAVLASIGVPALVVAGEEDRIASPEETRGWAGQIAAARVEIIPRAGHLPCLEQPEAFETALSAFLARLGS